MLHCRLCFLQCVWRRENSLQKVININEAWGIDQMSLDPLLSWVGSGHETMQTVAKHTFEEFANISKVLQASPTAKMAWHSNFYCCLFASLFLPLTFASLVLQGIDCSLLASDSFTTSLSFYFCSTMFSSLPLLCDCWHALAVFLTHVWTTCISKLSVMDFTCILKRDSCYNLSHTPPTKNRHCKISTPTLRY